MGRPHWVEWEGKLPAVLDVAPEVHLLTVLGQPDSVEALRESLPQELAQTGIASDIGEAWRLATTAILDFGWYGFVAEDHERVWCTGDGLTADEDMVDRAMPCVYAVITR